MKRQKGLKGEKKEIRKVEANSSRLGVTNVKNWNMSTSWAIQRESLFFIITTINLGKWNKDEKEERGKWQLYLWLREFNIFLTRFNKEERSIYQIADENLNLPSKWECRLTGETNPEDIGTSTTAQREYVWGLLENRLIINEIFPSVCGIFMGVPWDLLLFWFRTSILY